MIHVKNLSDAVDENVLYNEFYKFGSIKNVKVIHPPQRSRHQCGGRNYGYVDFMEARDAKIAMRSLADVELFKLKMRLGWGNVPHDQCAHCQGSPGFSAFLVYFFSRRSIVFKVENEHAGGNRSSPRSNRKGGS